MTEFLPFLSGMEPVVIGLLLVIYAAITSVRKRRDTSITELEKRVKSLEEQIRTMKDEHEAEIVGMESKVTDAETKAEGYQGLMLAARADVFALRTVVADNGLVDPTIPAA